jgi:hypothetical protein
MIGEMPTWLAQAPLIPLDDDYDDVGVFGTGLIIWCALAPFTQACSSVIGRQDRGPNS